MKKGFTLIELLATIVVLGMLAVITTPIVLNTINNSKRNSAKAAALSYVDTFNKEISVEDYYETKRSFRIQKDGSLLSNGTTTKLDTKGILPTDGIICLDENNSVTIYSLLVDGYVINYYGEEQEIIKGDKALNLTCDVTKEVVTMSINSNTCSKTKIVTIEFPPIASVKKQYRINSGEWLEYSEPLVMKDNATVYARLYDGANSSNMATLTVSKMDKEDVSKTKPNVILSAVNPTNSVVVTFRQTDDCGLDNDTIEYGISRDNKTYTWQKDNYFMKLKNNTLYYVKTRANDIAGSGLKESDAFTITTGEIATPVIAVDPRTEWSTSKTVTITGVTTGARLQYQIGKTTGTWLDYTEPFKVAQNTTIYARLYDGVNASSTSTYTITTVDTVAPNCTVIVSSYSLSSVTLSASCTDTQSGVAKYEFSKDLGSTYTDKGLGTALTFSSLEISKMRVRTTDSVGNKDIYVVDNTSKRNAYKNIATLTSTTMAEMKNNTFLTGYPVGSIYTTTSSSENTAAKMASLHGGTWVAYGTGRKVVGIDTNNSLFNTIEKTGGTSSVGLSANQIPSLTITGTTNSTGSGYSIGYTYSDRTTSTNGNHTHYLRSLNRNVIMDYSMVFERGDNRGGLNYEESYDYIYADTAGNHSHTYPDYYLNGISGVASHNHTFTGYYTNNSKANISTQDQYIVAYMWKRTA